MNVQTQALLITAFISLIFALLVWTRKERSRTTLPFSLCNLFLFIHAASYVGLKLSGENLFLRTHIAAAVFLAPAYLYLMYSYLFQPNRVVDGLLVSLFGFAAVFAVTAFVPSVDAALHFLALYPPAERPVREATTTLLIAAVMLVMALVRILRERQSFSRRRYLGLFAATLLTAIALSFSRLMGGGPGGPIALVLYHYYLYQTLVRFQSFSVARMVGRLAVLTFSAVFLAIVYGLFFFFMRPFPIFFIFHTIAAAFILMIIYDPFLAGLGTKAREFVIRGRGEGRRTIERLVDDISRQWTLEQIVTFLSVHVPQALDLPSAVLYPSAEGGGFERASPGETGLERVPAELAETIADVAVEPVNLDRLLQQSSEGYPGQERERLLELIEFVDACQGRWLVPLRYRNDLVGVFIPGESSAADIGGEAETILRILADQAAVRLVNARIFQRLRSQDRLATLGEMAASLAHEIRNPLGSMKGAAQYLLDEDLPKDNREFVEIILAEAERLNDVLTRFLDYARPFGLSRSDVDINDLVRRTLAFIAEGDLPEGVTLTAELDDAVGRRYVDGKQLRQVLINLVQNAYQAQPNGGETVVSTRVGEGKVFIDVADRAPVVPPADRDKLFMPFFTTKDGGSGLGLTISQRIVEAHGGTIQCLPRPGGGNRFVVELPAEAEG